ncbi:hypothetical protein AAHB60_06695 [Pseudomonas aeruginosa]
MAGFVQLVADMDEIIADVLGDGEFGYLDRSGRQVGNAAVIVEEGVERMEAGALDRYRTIACRKAVLQPLDRKGAFLDSDGQVLAHRRHPCRRRRLDHFLRGARMSDVIDVQTAVIGQLLDLLAVVPAFRRRRP